MLRAKATRFSYTDLMTTKISGFQLRNVAFNVSQVDIEEELDYLSESVQAAPHLADCLIRSPATASGATPLRRWYDCP